MTPFKIYGDNIDDAALDQFHSALECPFAVQGALMPDAHLGYSLPIGGVVATKDVVVPAWVGYDIGCGMCAIPTTFSGHDVRSNAHQIYSGIQDAIPVGFKHRGKKQEWPAYETTFKTTTAETIFNFRDGTGFKQLGTLGGGNHFIEIGVDKDDAVWVVIHSGSRGIGHTIATHYMKAASGDGKAREGHFGLHVDSDEGKGYLIDHRFATSFALENRVQMLLEIGSVLRNFAAGSMIWSELINRNHNHVDDRDGLLIHRKGATHAEAGMRGVIPGNMRDGSFIVEGLGNPDSLYSSSHGAGRVLGRKQAKRVLDVKDFTYLMKGIVCNASESTLDEAPMAYKNIFEVMDSQTDLVQVLVHVTPIVNIKG